MGACGAFGGGCAPGESGGISPTDSAAPRVRSQADMRRLTRRLEPLTGHEVYFLVEFWH